LDLADHAPELRGFARSLGWNDAARLLYALGCDGDGSGRRHSARRPADDDANVRADAHSIARSNAATNRNANIAPDRHTGANSYATPDPRANGHTGANGYTGVDGHAAPDPRADRDSAGAAGRAPGARA
jgi:hypothetical protein